jgi:hypothetical protein
MQLAPAAVWREISSGCACGFTSKRLHTGPRSVWLFDIVMQARLNYSSHSTRDHPGALILALANSTPPRRRIPVY